MKPFALLCVLVHAAAAAIPSGASADKNITIRHDCDSDNLFRGDNVDVDLNDGSIVFTHEDDDETVEVTKDGGLVVNGTAVRLAGAQRELVEEYYATFDGVMDEATRDQPGPRGSEDRREGREARDLAVVGALLLIADDRDAEDLEAELDRKGEKIERMAERLEKRAKKLEARAESLEEVPARRSQERDRRARQSRMVLGPIFNNDLQQWLDMSPSGTALS